MVLVIFRAQVRVDADLDAYAAMSVRLHDLVEKHPGYVSFESFTTETGEEVSLEMFDSMESVDAWRRNREHMEAQRFGRDELYEWYSVQKFELTGEYGFSRERESASASS